MFRDLYEVIRDFLKKVITSRIFSLSILFIALFAVLIFRLFKLQVVDGQEYLDTYKLKSEKVLPIASTRGNIYDRNGVLIAYNELAYSVTLLDIGAYPKRNDFNRMILDLINILKKHDVPIKNEFGITMNEQEEFVYVYSNELAKKRFLRDYYGLKTIEDLDKNIKHPSDITAQEIFTRMIGDKGYNLTALKDSDGNLIELTKQEMLEIVSIRYALSLVSYQKYMSITIADNVNDKTIADILEHSAQLQGVKIEEQTIRKYNDDVEFAQVIGYTGKASKEDLLDLFEQNPEYALSDSQNKFQLNLPGQEENPVYTLNDTVGKSGLEKEMELDLHGEKGSQTVFLDSSGRVMDVLSSTNPVAGNDIYLTIDRNLQVGIYKLIEQQLAGVLKEKIVNRDFEIKESMDSSSMEIPIKTAYYKLIYNNVLSIGRFALPEASETEQGIYRGFLSKEANVLDIINGQLRAAAPTPQKNLSKELQIYMKYIQTYLGKEHVSILIKSNINQEDPVLKLWNEDSISLREFLYYGLANNWIDTTKMPVDSKYANADDVYAEMVNYIISSLSRDVDFNKLLYQYMIEEGSLTGRELCIALYDQGVLSFDEAAVNGLKSNGSNYAFNFFISKIASLEITPAQLALDPSSAFCVVTDVKNGEVLALVSYPSYENNRFSNSDYYNQLNNDKSLPLFNNATQVKTAPGSIFKPLSVIIGLEEGVVGLNEKITDTGVFEKIFPPIKCWIHPNGHGPLSAVGALQNSCNYYFSEIGYRLGTDSTGEFSDELGIEKIQKYTTLFGLDKKSGIEIGEATPTVTSESAVRSMIGQGTNSYSAVQIARYLTTLANRGTVYDLSLLDKRTDVEGNLLEDYTPDILSTLAFKNSTWNAVNQGMRLVVTEGSARDLFADMEIQIAGKTGTAQENKLRANHGLFISYGPFEDPEISVTVQIPYGYTSANAALISKNVYRLYYDIIDLDTINNSEAAGVSRVRVGE